MFNEITAEQAGISSLDVRAYLDYLNRRGVVMHGALLMKGEDIFSECHWAPFHKDLPHRMYSQTKSYVAIAIGLLVDEGKLSLTDKIASFFPEKIEGKIGGYLAEQTVEDTLLMSTAGASTYWFHSERADRTEIYFNENANNKIPHTVWEYDSAGSQVLGCLVEKLSGMSLLEYLKSKLFHKMGTFQNARILKTRNDDSWADSALICTQRDMASMLRLLLNGGKWKGEQLLSESYVKRATSVLIDNDETGYGDCFKAHGYGYQIWHTEMGGFAFVGMGGQLSVAIPSLDTIFVCTGDNQGYAAAYDIIINGLFDYVLRKMSSVPLPENKEAKEALDSFCRKQQLFAQKNKCASDFANEINGVKYACQENKMGITDFTFAFDGEKGTLFYHNAQGEKALPFGLGYNAFGLFPQLGYSNEHGGRLTTDGFQYECAVSAGWSEEKKLRIKVQIIDRYFGNIAMTFSFKEDECMVRMVKHAEDFLAEYNGDMLAKRVKK